MADSNSKPYGFVYLITNSVTGKKYVGQTTKSIQTRLRQHEQLQGKCPALESAIKKYGREAFSILPLAQAQTQVELNSEEGYWIETFRTVSPGGYNLRGGGGQIGAMHAETKEKLRVASSTDERREFLRGLRKRPEVLARYAESSRENWESKQEKMAAGRARPEVQLRRKESVRKAWKDPELLDRQRLHLAEIAQRPEVKEARSEALRRLWSDPEHSQQRGANISSALIGHKKKIDYSDEAKAHRKEIKKRLWSDPAYRASQLEKMNTPEVRQKRGDAIRAGWARRRERLAAEQVEIH